MNKLLLLMTETLKTSMAFSSKIIRFLIKQISSLSKSCSISCHRVTHGTLQIMLFVRSTRGYGGRYSVKTVINYFHNDKLYSQKLTLRIAA